MTIEDKDKLVRESIRRYGPSVLKRCQAILRNHALAEDAFQQTFIGFTRWLRAQPDKPDLDHVGGLVLAIAERTSIDFYRKRQRHEEVSLEGHLETSAPKAGEWLYVEELLDRLSPRERRIVELSVFGELKAPQIADDLGLTPNAVRTAKSRALNKLRTILKIDVTLPGVRSDE